jgi:hypothetical protein
MATNAAEDLITAATNFCRFRTLAFSPPPSRHDWPQHAVFPWGIFFKFTTKTHWFRQIQAVLCNSKHNVHTNNHDVVYKIITTKIETSATHCSWKKSYFLRPYRLLNWFKRIVSWYHIVLQRTVTMLVVSASQDAGNARVWNWIYDHVDQGRSAVYQSNVS